MVCRVELAYATRESKELYVVPLVARMDDAEARMMLGTLQVGVTVLQLAL